MSTKVYPTQRRRTVSAEKYSKWHTYWSYAKSALRIAAAAAGATGSLFWFAVGMGVAEILGIVEEMG